MNLFSNKRGYFFIIDAFVAMTILSVGLFLILSSYFSSAPESQLSMSSKDILNYMTGTKIVSFVDPTGNINKSELLNRGSIQNSLAEQTLEYLFLGQDQVAHDLVKNAIEQIVPVQFEVKVVIDGNHIYNRSFEDFSDSENLIPSRAYILTVFNQTDVLGPALFEVYLWR